MSNNDVAVRAMTSLDLGPARRLLAQLGYDIAPDELDHRFAAVRDAGDGHALLVAEFSGEIVGLVHIFDRPALEKPTEALVQSLVIDETRRGNGIGRTLMKHAEAWAKARGFTSVALHTQLKRMDARAFYGALGYHEVGEAALLRKKLDN